MNGNSDPLCIIAGSGLLPHHIVTQCQGRGESYIMLALDGMADGNWLQDIPHRRIPLGKIVTALRELRSQGVSRIVLAGGVKKPKWRSWMPDRYTAMAAARIFSRSWSSKGQGDDQLLRVLIKELEDMGFTVLSPQSLGQGLLAEEKVYGRHKPSRQDYTDIHMGMRAARSLGAFDIGQAVIVHRQRIIGVEAAEGTDALIRRCAGLLEEGFSDSKSGCGILVKTSKPEQEPRVDLPCVGEKTVRQCVKANLRGMVIEAGYTLMLDKDKMVKLADRHGLFIVATPPQKTHKITPQKTHKIKPDNKAPENA